MTTHNTKRSEGFFESWKRETRRAIREHANLNCRACGCFIPTPDLVDSDSIVAAYKIYNRLLCEECANEIVFGVISTRPATLYSANSNYSPLESNPGQENAIRAYEDRFDHLPLTEEDQ